MDAQTDGLTVALLELLVTGKNKIHKENKEMPPPIYGQKLLKHFLMKVFAHYMQL